MKIDIIVLIGNASEYNHAQSTDMVPRIELVVNVGTLGKSLKKQTRSILYNLQRLIIIILAFKSPGGRHTPLVRNRNCIVTNYLNPFDVTNRLELLVVYRFGIFFLDTRVSYINTLETLL